MTVESVPMCVLHAPACLIPPCLHSRSGSMSMNTIAPPVVRCLTSLWVTSTTSVSSARTSAVSVTRQVSPRTQLESSRQVQGPAAWPSAATPGCWPLASVRVGLTLWVFLSLGITLKPLEYKEHDFRTAPKFLTPLMDRVVVAGYSAALNCAVRGHPKVPQWGLEKSSAACSPRPTTPAVSPCQSPQAEAKSQTVLNFLPLDCQAQFIHEAHLSCSVWRQCHSLRGARDGSGGHISTCTAP